MIRKELLDKVQDLNFWYRKQDTGIRREELEEALKFVEDKRTVLVIMGVRRAGKTLLARQILAHKLKDIKEGQTLHVNFEDPTLEPYLNTESLEDLYESYRYVLNREGFACIVFDEIHNIPKWEKWVRMALEKSENAKFIITGSSSKVSRGEIASVLAGRTITLTLFPLSFRGFLEFRGYKPKEYETYKSLDAHLNEYLEYGGFPLIVLTEKEKNTYLKELFDDIVTKDIILKYKLREPAVKTLAVLLINNFGALVSVRKLVNLMQAVASVKVSPTSVNKYLYYFEDAFLFLFLPIFSYKIKDVMQYPRKAYCIDNGLINAMSLRFFDNIGRIYENTVAIELLRRHGKENLFYWKGRGEVDFVVKEGLKVRQLIQVCYDIKAPDTKKREVKALLEAGEELGCADLLLITSQYEAEESIDGKKIVFMPLWKWLLEK